MTKENPTASAPNEHGSAKNDLLRTTVKAWEPVEMKNGISPAPENGKSYGGVMIHALFHTVRDNPGLSAQELYLLMVDQGYEDRRSSLSPLLTQLIRRGMIARDVEGKYSAVVNEYKTTSDTSRGAAGRAKANKPKPAKKPSKPAATATKPPAQPEASTVSRSTRDWLDGITIGEARALYDELKKLFK